MSSPETESDQNLWAELVPTICTVLLKGNGQNVIVNIKCDTNLTIQVV